MPFKLTFEEFFIASFATMFCLLIARHSNRYWMKLKVPEAKPIVEGDTTSRLAFLGGVGARLDRFIRRYTSNC